MLLEATIKAYEERDRRKAGKKHFIAEYERLEALKKELSELFLDAQLRYEKAVKAKDTLATADAKKKLDAADKAYFGSDL